MGGTLDVNAVITGATDLQIGGKIRVTPIINTFTATVSVGNSAVSTITSTISNDPGSMQCYRYNGTQWALVDRTSTTLIWIRVVTNTGGVAIYASSTGGGTMLIRAVSA